MTASAVAVGPKLPRASSVKRQASSELRCAVRCVFTCQSLDLASFCPQHRADSRRSGRLLLPCQWPCCPRNAASLRPPRRVCALRARSQLSQPLPRAFGRGWARVRARRHALPEQQFRAALRAVALASAACPSSAPLRPVRSAA